MSNIETVSCAVESISPLTENVYRILLKPETSCRFIAGQYICVKMGTTDLRPFSIASSPSENEYIELHVGATPDNPYAWEVLKKAREEQVLTISLPQGEAGYRASSRDLLLVAGGTGFSYAWSIAQAHLETSESRKIVFYWGAKQLSDLYAYAELKKLAERDARFDFRPVVEQAEADWKGRTGWVHQAVMNDFDTLADFDIYIAGRFEMVKTARDDFYRKGLPNTQLFGDALSFID
ncbi:MULTISPECIES: NAD(P)H-flavin reductase [Gammaproteobacteria]|uniref:NAD(P)H-flavin reductase n=1 Tax=Gammaproteobacteria TaxID=1236 RepID=UPI000DCFEAE5|nr:MULTISPECIES: NAD(P)H-flavin reductase [Gammaproteobacteria]RTE85753.1 NAD(P)H-flavin reductase [Aliidiomarina sp. B3213]TCZ90245.1 NAD(P)H-flavin reductase [Lysobacter sp. N42]